MARPRPVVPPVTTATLPVKSNKVWRIEEILYRIGRYDESREAPVDSRRHFLAKSGQLWRIYS
jgi:hypothetical protein